MELTIQEKMIEDEQHDYVEVNLEEDIYCLAYLAFLNTNIRQRELDTYVLKCIFTFFFQAIVVGLLLS